MMPGWLDWAMPWGTSLTVHVLVLVLAAIFALSPKLNGRSELIVDSRFEKSDVDLTTLAKADKAGDPFTDLDAPEPPSLPLDLDHLDPNKSNIPELPPNFRIGPDVQLVPPTTVQPDLNAVPGSGKGRPKSDAPLMAPFSGRQGPERRETGAPRRRDGRIGKSGRSRPGVDRPPPARRRRLEPRLLAPLL